MSIYLFKSILSVVIILLTIISMYTMLEMLGRSQVKVDVRKYKKIHKAAGFLYIGIFMIASYFCLYYIYISRAELTPRSNLHSILSLSILVLFGMKLLITRVYKQFHNYVNIYGLLIALITFGMVGSSAGYYLIVSRLGTDISFDKIAQYKHWASTQKRGGAPEESAFAAGPESISRGEVIFKSKCSFCHDTKSTETIVGPGLKGILKNRELPFSRKPATPDNLRNQLVKPFGRMPSFDYLTKEEMDDVIAFLSTL
ncbi:MAG: cytochrome c [Nitrospirae bacterium]|nr:cytochrome c [Nitrospirota bacterium]